MDVPNKHNNEFMERSFFPFISKKLGSSCQFFYRISCFLSVHYILVFVMYVSIGIFISEVKVLKICKISPLCYNMFLSNFTCIWVYFDLFCADVSVKVLYSICMAFSSHPQEFLTPRCHHLCHCATVAQYEIENRLILYKITKLRFARP